MPVKLRRNRTYMPVSMGLSLPVFCAAAGGLNGCGETEQGNAPRPSIAAVASARSLSAAASGGEYSTACRALTFIPKSRSAVGTGPWELTSADLNQDGAADVVTVNHDSGTFSVLSGYGDGRFAPAVTGATGELPYDVVVGDLNLDGFADLVTANMGGDVLAVYWGAADGGFLPGPQISLANGSQPKHVVVADFDKDGSLDLAAANYGTDTVAVVLGDGQGSFFVFQYYEVAAATVKPRSLETADFNNDGIADLAVGTWWGGRLYVLLGGGSGGEWNGTFSALPYAAGTDQIAVHAAELSGDAALDLIVANHWSDRLHVLLGRGDGTFGAPSVLSTGQEPSVAPPQDLNGDGNADLLVVEEGRDTVCVMLGSGGGEFLPCRRFAVGDGPLAGTVIGTTPYSSGFAAPNLVSANWHDHSVSILEGHCLYDGEPQLAHSIPSAAGSGPWTLETADLNEDGFADIATVNREDSTLSILLGNGDGTFLPAVNMPTGEAPYDLTFGDVNLDDVLDIVTADASGNSVSVFLGNGSGGVGNGTFTAQSPFVLSVAAAPKHVVIVDFDDDGVPDLATANSARSTVSILRGSGDGEFSEHSEHGIGATSVHPRSLDFGDFDNDGLFDLVVGTWSSSSVSILLGNGADRTWDGTFTVSRYEAGDGQVRVYTEDFDRDGNEDIAVVNYNGSSVNVLYGFGDGGFSAPVSHATLARPTSAQPFDENGDGILDLIVSERDNDSVCVLRGTDGGGFAACKRVAVGNGPMAAVGLHVSYRTNDPVMANIATADYYGNTVTLLGKECSVDGDCDNGSVCSVDTCASGQCVHEGAPAGTLCRPATELCDVAELCDGESLDCPPDSFAPPTQRCRQKAGLCDIAEVCPGDGPSCPRDEYGPSSVVCRAAAGECDVAELCTGVDPNCPDDDFESPGVVCRLAKGDCDVEEQCPGIGPDCPSDVVLPEGLLCRDVTGVCDVAEYCNGTDPVCPTDVFEPSELLCRGRNGSCDLAETCTGAGPQCPDDLYQPEGFVCREEGGGCDVAESCTGTGPQCPDDQVLPAGFVCREQAGACDIAEVCTGADAQCPSDQVEPEGQVCRPAARGCDVPETCLGPSQPYCPDDLYVPDGTTCDDGLFCSVGDECVQGFCVGGVPNACDDENVCTLDSCDEAEDRCVNSWFGRPSGGFSAGVIEVSVKPTGETVDFGPRDLLAADFDGDGLTDLATANSANDSVSVLVRYAEAVPAGNPFKAPVTKVTGLGPVRLQAFESTFAGQVVVNIATANEVGNSVSVLVGDGAGDFTVTDEIQLGDGTGPTSIVAGLFNDDDYPDLLTCNPANDTVSLLLGAADSVVGSPTVFNVASNTQPRACVAGPFTPADSLLDVVIANQGTAEQATTKQLTTLRGQIELTGEFSFAPPEYSTALGAGVSITSGDFNTDGILDVAVANRSTFGVDIYTGGGAGGFNHYQSLEGIDGTPRYVLAADINGDTLLDLLLATGSRDEVYLLLGQPDRSFTIGSLGAGIWQPTSVAVLEATGDGVVDLAVASYGDDAVHLFPGELDPACEGWHCHDQIVNYDERRADCGGSCPPCDECTSGVCCDVANGVFSPPTQQCDAYEESQCGDTACGAPILRRSVQKFCSGASAWCDGAIQANGWVFDGLCDDESVCEDRTGELGEALASCEGCPFGCSEGACYPECNPDLGEPCCSSTGTMIASCYQDTETTYEWWHPPTTSTLSPLSWNDAVALCTGLDVGGHTDWQLPTVDDLRTLIVGCAATDATLEPGDCDVVAGCLDSGPDSVCVSDSCLGCGTTADGSCYWPAELVGDCTEYSYWSSSASSDQSGMAWSVRFDLARIQAEETDYGGWVRCVRKPE